MGLAELFNSNQKKPIEEINSDLKAITQDLLRVNGKIQVFVFGSVAKGEATKTSDYDIAVVIEDSVDKKHFISEFYRNRSRLHTPVDFIFRNKSEFHSKQNDNMIDQTICLEGVEIYPQWKLSDKI